MKQRHLLVLVLLVCLLHPLQTRPQSPGQQPAKPASEQAVTDDQDVIKINTNLVQIDAVVTRNGQQVTDLNAEDFEVFEDGKPQPITNFSYISNVSAAPVATKRDPLAPPIPASVRPSDTGRTIALVVDDLGMGFQNIERVRTQLRKFVNERLTESDLVAILRTSGEIGALQQFTTDHRVLLSAIDHIKFQPCSRAGFDTFSGNPRDCSSETYDLSLRALRYVVTGMTNLPGRKSMVVFSDMMPIDFDESGLGPESPPPLAPASGAGAEPVVVPKVSTGGSAAKTTGPSSVITDFLNNTYERKVQNIAELAIRGSVVIYTVDTRGLEVTFPTAADHFSGPVQGRGNITRQVGDSLSQRSSAIFNDRQGAELMAKSTGGFAITDSNDFGLKKVYEDQQGYYLIGFRPAEVTFNHRFHHLGVRVKRPGLVVRTRKGFYGITDTEAQATLRMAPNSVSDALRSPFGINQITVRLNSLFSNAKDAGSLLRAFIYVGANDLSFKVAPDGSHDAAFEIESVLFGDNGQMVYDRNQSATIHLNQTQYEQILREGIAYGFRVPLKGSGASQFRVAVRDRGTGRMGTAGQVIVIPNLRKDRLALSGIVLTAETSSQAASGAETSSVPVLRPFHQGETLMFAFAVYKAQLGSDHLPRLTSQTRIFHDGNLFYTGETVPIAMNDQPDLQRITSGSRLKLGTDFPAGEYVLQIIVVDSLAKEKDRMVTQWIGFDVIK